MKYALALVAAFSVAPALAHHGWGSYDAERPITIKGSIQKITLQNPHGEMTLPDPAGAWVVTLAPLSRMNSRGATTKVLQQGVAVTAYGYPKRDGSREMRAEWVEVNGQRFQLR